MDLAEVCGTIGSAGTGQATSAGWRISATGGGFPRAHNQRAGRRVATVTGQSLPKAVRRRPGATSIRDVAAAAGVSYQTVSRVLNDSPRVSPDTRRLVLDVIGRMDYRPNRAARALGLGRA